MKRRIIIGIILLAAYPFIAEILILIDHNNIFTIPMGYGMMIIFLAGLVSFCGFAMLIGEYQSWKQVRRLKKNQSL
jgi:hypothetical protein